jgi:hypothetical protein
MRQIQARDNLHVVASRADKAVNGWTDEDANLLGIDSDCSAHINTQRPASKVRTCIVRLDGRIVQVR